jgi:hypothetical protein
VIILPAVSNPEIAGDLVRAYALAASGRFMESLTEVTDEYETGIKVIERE